MRRVSSRQRLVSWDAFDATQEDDGNHSDCSDHDGPSSYTSIIVINDGSLITTNTTPSLEESGWMTGRKRSRNSEPPQAAVGVASTGTTAAFLLLQPPAAPAAAAVPSIAAVLIPSFSWEIEPTLASLCQDTQVHIMSFLDESSLRQMAGVNTGWRSFLLSSSSETKEIIWTPHLTQRWMGGIKMNDHVFKTLEDRHKLPTAAMFEDMRSSSQEIVHSLNLPLLLSMTPANIPTELDTSLLDHASSSRRASRRTTLQLMRALTSTSTHLKLIPDNGSDKDEDKHSGNSTNLGDSKVVAYTGPIGAGDRCVRANHPFPRPTSVQERPPKGSSSPSTTTAVPENPRSPSYPIQVPGVHSVAAGSLLSLLLQGARTIRGKTEQPWRPFCSPYYQKNGALNVTPRLVAYYEVEIMMEPKKERGTQSDDEEDLPPVRGQPAATNASACVAVGLATEAFRLHSRMPGWDNLSFGYHGDDGGIFHASGVMTARFGPTFGAGDTVGCGIDYVTRGIFFTLNGKFLGYGWKNLKSDLLNHDLYPVVGIDTNSPIRLNFGTSPQRPFLYDLEEFHVNHERLIQPYYQFSSTAVTPATSRCNRFSQHPFGTGLLSTTRFHHHKQQQQTTSSNQEGPAGSHANPTSSSTTTASSTPGVSKVPRRRSTSTRRL